MCVNALSGLISFLRKLWLVGRGAKEVSMP